MKVVAILSVYNEEVYISRCLQHLIDQGIKVCVIDNESTDRTFEIVSSFLNRGVIHIETIHREGIFNWDSILRRKEELS
jgi:glycosyltransferase involved in cell wall biosynthesis